MNKLIAVILALGMFSCSETKDHQQETIATSNVPASSATDSASQIPSDQQNRDSALYEDKLKNYLVASIPDNDFTYIAERAGIFIGPDTVEIEHLKKEYGEEDFYTAADDNQYYEYEAGEYLEQKGIKTVYPKTRYLKLKPGSGKEYFFDTKPEGGSSWYLILFDPAKNFPVIISTIDITEEYSTYFGHK